MQETELKELLKRYKADIATDEEKAFLESWYLKFGEESLLEYTADERLEDAEAVWLSLQPKRTNPGTAHLWPRIAAAALALVFFSFGAAYYLRHKQKPVPFQQITKTKLDDIAPGGNKAILTLSNGNKILLTGARNGKLAIQGNTAVSKTATGQIVYNTVADAAPNPRTVTYNTITTPRGGQYWIVLSDGSKVLLNASSSLRYPAAFTGNERKVELTGEAYFEIAHQDALPFRVITNHEVVEDIGTHFNINAYNDDHITKTTLLEGSVSVSNGNQQVILKPGQQSHLGIGDRNQSIEVIENADTEAAIAWKNGLFEFKNTAIQQVMNDVGRWYDLDVVYEGGKSDLKISGRISRNVNLSGIMNLLQFEGLKFKVEGKTVTMLN